MIISRKCFTYLSVTDDEGIMSLSTVGYLDDVTKFSNFIVLGEFDAVRILVTLCYFCILTVVCQLEFCAGDHCACREKQVSGFLHHYFAGSKRVIEGLI